MQEQLARWTKAFDEGMASEGDVDLEPVWNEVSEAIAANPDDAGLRRLRARMAEAFYQHTVRHEDLLALRRIDPTDREALLGLALVQHRWAHMLVPDDGTGEIDEDDDFDEDDGDEEESAEMTLTVRVPGQPDTPEAALEKEAKGWLSQLLTEHKRDADFTAEVFRRWSDASIYAPWQRLTHALAAAAAHPKDERFTRILAESWGDLADQSPEDFDSDQGQVPMGFMVDTQGNLWDPFMQERALDGYARLLERHPGDADLLSRRARLLEARADFEAAASEWGLAQAAYGRDAAKADADEAREQAASLATEAGEKAEACRAGRAAISESFVDGMEEAMAKLGQGFPEREGASEAATAFMQQMRETMLKTVQDLQPDLDSLRESQLPPEPTPEAMEQMRQNAAMVAGNVVANTKLAPQGKVIAPRAFEQDWAADQQAPRDAFAGLGWKELGWIEWPGYRAMFGHQVVSSVWVDPASGSVAIVSLAKGTLVLDLEAEFEEGGMVVTTPTRGKNFFTGGPEVDTLLVEPALSVAEACALHIARVELALAQRPGRRAKHFTDVAQVLAMQERGHLLKVKFRMANGLTDSEALGVPADYPEVFAPMLQEEVRKGLAAS